MMGDINLIAGRLMLALRRDGLPADFVRWLLRQCH
jgi:hypothetical protein